MTHPIGMNSNVSVLCCGTRSMKPTPGPVLKNRNIELKLLINCLTLGHTELRIPELDAT